MTELTIRARETTTGEKCKLIQSYCTMPLSEQTQPNPPWLGSDGIEGVGSFFTAELLPNADWSGNTRSGARWREHLKDVSDPANTCKGYTNASTGKTSGCLENNKDGEQAPFSIKNGKTDYQDHVGLGLDAMAPLLAAFNGQTPNSCACEVEQMMTFECVFKARNPGETTRSLQVPFTRPDNDIEKKFTAKSATVATVENTRAGFTSHPKDYTP
jgi:hypothetical protein